MFKIAFLLAFPIFGFSIFVKSIGLIITSNSKEIIYELFGPKENLLQFGITFVIIFVILQMFYSKKDFDKDNDINEN